MSLIIKGVDMPKSGESIKYSSKEIIEIPRPHGRLIDADRLMKVIEKNSYLLKGYYNSLENGMFLTGIKQAIDEAPTIIEAEVSE